jgi:hypothetical protein
MHPLSPVLSCCVPSIRYLGFTTRYSIRITAHYYSFWRTFYSYLGLRSRYFIWVFVYRYLLLGLCILRLPFRYTHLQLAAWVYHPLFIRFMHPLSLVGFTHSLSFIGLSHLVFYLGVRTHYPLFGFTHLLFCFLVYASDILTRVLRTLILRLGLPPAIYFELPLTVYMSVTLFGLTHPLSSIWVHAPIIIIIIILCFGFLWTLLSFVLGLRTSHLSFGLIHPRFAFRFYTPSFYFHSIYHPPFIRDYHLPFTWLHTHYPLFERTHPDYFDLCAFILVKFTYFCVLVWIYVLSFVFRFAYPLPLSSFAHQLLFLS